MSFDTLKVSELRKIAEDFAVDTEGLKTKTDIVAALADEGVTWSVYQNTLEKIADSEEEAEEVLPRFDAKAGQPENTVLVRMTRANYRYDIGGFTFTREHPFVAMAQDDAQKIFDKEEGFRLATPTEVQEYYS